MIRRKRSGKREGLNMDVFEAITTRASAKALSEPGPSDEQIATLLGKRALARRITVACGPGASSWCAGKRGRSSALSSQR